MKLYDFPGSPNGKKVRVCARELGVPLNIVPLNLQTGENRKAEYLGKNPMGKIPTLEEDDGNLLWESNAIMIYLAIKHADKGLLPTDPRGRADTMRWLFWNASHFQPACGTVCFERVVKPLLGQPADEPTIQRGMRELERFTPVLNGALEAKPYVAGGAYGLADISIGCWVEFAMRAGVDFAPYTHVRSWLTRLQARDAWKNA
jgi:glutathione S-transferase